MRASTLVLSVLGLAFVPAFLLSVCIGFKTFALVREGTRDHHTGLGKRTIIQHCSTNVGRGYTLWLSGALRFRYAKKAIATYATVLGIISMPISGNRCTKKMTGM